jgi:hypothetical protein
LIQHAAAGRTAYTARADTRLPALRSLASAKGRPFRLNHAKVAVGLSNR